MLVNKTLKKHKTGKLDNLTKYIIDSHYTDMSDNPVNSFFFVSLESAFKLSVITYP